MRWIDEGYGPLGQSRLEGFNDRIAALYARGMTSRDLRAHLREIYDAEVSPDLISPVTDGVLDELTAWQSRPPGLGFPGGVHRCPDGQVRGRVVANRPVMWRSGSTVAVRNRRLACGSAPTGESAKFWMTVLSELRNRGVKDVCILCCDGLSGLPDAVTAVWPQTTVQLCVVHLIRASVRYAFRKYWPTLAKELRTSYTATDATAAEAPLRAFADAWEQRYRAIVGLWRTHFVRVRPVPGFPAAKSDA